MVFSSLTFLFGYFPIVLLVMKASPLKWRNAILFFVSLIFYGWSEPYYILLMLLSTTVDYFIGMMVDRNSGNPKIAKRFVLLSVVFNLSMLGFFKYADFLILNINHVFGLSIKTLNLTLPVGISFYTFQTMSYPIDVYRKDAHAQKSFIDFGAYVAMFPQLIAGPIVRYKDIATQLNHREETGDKFVAGIERFMVGLGKKVLLANSAGQLFTTIKNLPDYRMSMLLAWIGIIAYAFQIYFDFSGYSDMAIGLGKMFGFEFLENFNYPYIAKSITDFWRRWHISLSSWFKDYVYIPLGGNRKGLKRQLLNILIVWFLTGFWHGASWNYIMWGLYFGGILMLEKMFLLKRLEKVPAFIQHFYTLFLVLISWVFFTFEDLNVMKTYFGYMFDFSNIVNATALFYLRDQFVVLIICAIASTPLAINIYQKLNTNVKEWATVGFVILGFLICIAFLVDASFNPFLYFRF